MRRANFSNPGEQGQAKNGEIPDRRAEDRIQTVMRIGRVVADRDQGLVRVKNLSDHGARLGIRIPLRVGQVIGFELAEGETMTARVIWAESGECGLRFDHIIDCAELLTRLAQSAEQGTSRPLRLSISKPAVIRSERGLRLAAVEDVSIRGMKLRHDGSLTENMVVKITLPSGIERSGVVRWSNERIAGVLLLTPFCAEELGSSCAL